MTEALRNKIGDSLYGTLTNGLAGRYGGWFEWKKVPGHRDPYRLITPEGVSELTGWSQAQLDLLSGIGPVKAERIYDALEQLRQSEGPIANEDDNTLSPGDSLYFPE